MTRDEMAKLAQATALGVVLPEPGVRVSVIVTDAEGAFIGVGSNSSIGDTKAQLFCALYGSDRIDHKRTTRDKRIVDKDEVIALITLMFDELLSPSMELDEMREEVVSAIEAIRHDP